MKKRVLSVVLSAAMVASLMVGCGAAKEEAPAAEAAATEAAPAEEIKEEAPAEAATETPAADTSVLGDDGKFTVGFDAEFPPYGYMDDNGEYVGFDLDLAQAVCDNLGWELVRQPIAWDAKDMELSTGAIDCIWNGFTINGREDAYTWSVPYIDNSQVFVVLSDSGIAAKSDLAGKNVGVQKDSSALAALTDEENQENIDLAASFAGMTEYDDYNTGFMDLEAGAIDALAVDIGVAQYQLSSRGDKFVQLEEVLSTEQYGIGFLLGNTALKDVVEAELLKLNADGTVKKVAEQYGIDPTQICLK